MIKKILSVIFITVILLDPVSTYAKSRGLSERQRSTADKIAEIASENWKEYGVLPSVAVTQAFVESSLGKNQVKPNNLWGIRPGGVYYKSYHSLKSGVYGYLDTIKDRKYRRYNKARFKKNYSTQIDLILQGGYYGEDDGGTIGQYYRQCIHSIEKYDFDKYDKKLFAKIRKKKAERNRKKKWEKTYNLVYDSTIPTHLVKADRSIIKKGTIQIWHDDVGVGIFDVSGGGKGMEIKVPYEYMDGWKVKIIVNEEAKG